MHLKSIKMCLAKILFLKRIAENELKVAMLEALKVCPKREMSSYWKASFFTTTTFALYIHRCTCVSPSVALMPNAIFLSLTFFLMGGKFEQARVYTHC